ncbi:MAG: FCD domain-containing protein, partial [Candidatus Dormibacteraeota bacterium]|nr:FCD domain-containing protein [Candidatus Dormibacteraeota bacterium]
EQQVVRAHAEICGAIAAGDGERAAALMTEHLATRPARDRGTPVAEDRA